MERGAWTDHRLDDLSKGIDARFDAVDARFDAVDARFDRMDARFDRMDARFDRLEDRFDRFQATLMWIGGGMIVGLVGVIAAVLARGV